MPAILYGVGPNSVNITSMVFESIQEGLEKVTPIMGEPKKSSFEGEDVYRWDTNPSNGGFVTDDGREVAGTEFFTRYYDGCGECYCLILTRPKTGTPLFAFDLD